MKKITNKAIQDTIAPVFSEKELTELQAYFYDEIVKLGKMPLRSNPSVRQLKIPSHKLKRGYEEINQFNASVDGLNNWFSKESKFPEKSKLQFTEFLCFISICKIIGILSKMKSLGVEYNFENIMQKLYLTDEVHIKNMLRLTEAKPTVVLLMLMNPDLFSNGHDQIMKEKEFDVINNLWVKTITEEKLLNTNNNE